MSRQVNGARLAPTRPSVARPPASPAEVRPRALVGRSAELAALASVVGRPPALAMIRGEAGIGKTRLVAELPSAPALAGHRFLVGACRQVRDPFPLGPVVEAVRTLAAEPGLTRLSPVAGTLRPLLPELAELLPPAPAPLHDWAAEQHRVFRGLVELLAAACPAVVVLEDLHWTDGYTLDFLRYLLADPLPALSLVLTFRDHEADPAIRTLTAVLPESAGRLEIALAPLDVAQTGVLAAAILDTDRVPEEFAEYLCRRASGLPFAIEELLALLRARGEVVRSGGSWTRQALAELDVPDLVRDQVRERVSHLSGDAIQVLEAAAVLHDPAPEPVLAATCLAPGTAVEAGLDELLEASVFVECGGHIGFRHVLAAQAVYEEIPGPRRQRLHARAAAALRTREPVPLGQLAHHLRSADELAEWVTVAEQAADQAAALGHDVEAARLLEQLLRSARLADAVAGRIAVKLAGAAVNLAADRRVVELLFDVLARDLPAPIRGELCLATAILLDLTRHDLPEQRRLCAEAVRHLDPGHPHLRALAMACLGIPHGAGVSLAEHQDWLRRAAAELARVADPDLRTSLQGKVAMIQVHAGDPAWRELTDQVVARVGGAVGNAHQSWAYYSIAVEACYVGHHAVSGRLLAPALAGAAEWASPTHRASLASGQGLLDYCRGCWDGLAERVEPLIDQLAGSAPGRLDAELVAGCLRLARGDLASARTRLPSRLAEVESSGGLSGAGLLTGALVRMSLADGDPAGAVSAVRRVLAVVESKGIWAPVVRGLPAITEAMVAAGQLDDARTLLRRAEAQLRGRDAPLLPAAMRHSRGLLAAADRRPEAAVRQLRAAADRYESLWCPYEAAQAREQAVPGAVATGDPTATELIRAALATYLRLGASRDLDRAAGAARRHGLSVPASHRRGRRGYGSQLSPREREVAGRAADGQTNEEIATALYLSVSTVEKHVTAAMRKLGTRSRRQLRLHLAAPT